MRKWMAVLTIILWIVAGVKQVWEQKAAEPVSVAEAFSREELPEIQSRVRYSGSCEKYLEEDGRKELLCSLAKEMHIENFPQTVTERRDNGSVTTAVIEGKEGKTTFTYLAVGTWLYDTLISPRCYVIVELETEGHMEAAVFYRNKLEEAASKLGLSGSAGLELKGSRPGKDSLEDYGNTAKALFSQVGAKEVSSWKTESLYRIYGYSPRLGSAVYRGEEAMNISFAAEYDSIAGMTRYRIGVPSLEE